MEEHTLLHPILGFVTVCSGWASAMCSQRKWTGDTGRIDEDHLFRQMMLWQDNDNRWIKHTGVRFELFKQIVELLAQDPLNQPRRQTHNLVPIERRLLITLFILRTGLAQSQLEVLVGRSQQAISVWFKQIIEGLIRIKDASGLYLPTELKELKEMARAFEEFPRSQLPNCLVAVDGTHIPVAAPNNDLSYMGAKGNTINIQAFVDANFIVRDVFYERSHCVGGFNDEDMYKWSSASVWAEEINKLNTLNIGGEALGFYIIGDGGYQLRRQLMIPYARPQGSVERLPMWQEQFNFYLSSCRMVVEQTFGMIKNRSPILRNCVFLRYKPETVLRIFVACCVIHNFCMMDGEVVPRVGIVHNGSVPSDLLNNAQINVAQEAELEIAKTKRLALASHLLHHHNIDVPI